MYYSAENESYLKTLNANIDVIIIKYNEINNIKYIIFNSLFYFKILLIYSSKLLFYYYTASGLEIRSKGGS